MGYIGNQTSNSYTSMDKQTITGNGGTSYTLDHVVSNAQEIEVFVNNVRQEPGVAYTVVDNALTMTGNVESTDDFYVIFQGKAVGTVVHPSDQNLKAIDGTFTGDGTFDGDLTVDTSTLKVDSTNNRVGVGTTSPVLKFNVDTGDVVLSRTTDGDGNELGEFMFWNKTNAGSGSGTSFVNDVASMQGKMVGTGNNSGGSLHFYTKSDGGSKAEALTIDGNGYVHMPKQPLFNVSLNGNNTTNGGTYATSGSPQINIGSVWSTTNHRFTAPVAGTYMIMWNGWTNYTSSYGYINAYKNGSNYYEWHFNHGTATLHEICGASFFIELAVNDYIDFRRGGGGSGTFSNLRCAGMLIA